MDADGHQKILVGVIIGVVVVLLFAWASGAGEPKYGSKAEYDAAVEAGLEPPEHLYDDRSDDRQHGR